MHRQSTKKIKIGDVEIGGGAPVSVQSMTNTDTRNIKATGKQIKLLAEAGCEIIRLAVPDMDAARAIGPIKAASKIPLVADIHFDYRLALEALRQGVDGLRLNPGNIGGKKEVAIIAAEALKRGVPIRVGVNSGSVSQDLLDKYGGPTPEAMVESAQKEIKMLEDSGFDLIKVSLKSSGVFETIAANRLMAQHSSYPLHLGVTEAGTLISGTVKSSLGIGLLLAEGIGDTIRVSLTEDPVLEMKVAFEILRALNLRRHGVEIISCPTCGRCEIDLFGLVDKVEKSLSNVKDPIKVAVMGCVVNGPGEAKSADVGIAGGKGQGIIFKQGRQLFKVPENELADSLLAEINSIIEKNRLKE